MQNEKSIPVVSRPASFLAYHRQFFEQNHHAHAYEGMLSLILHKALKDKEFKIVYEKAKKDGKVDEAEMLNLVTEMCRIADDLGWFEWEKEETEELIVPGCNPIQTP